MKRLLFLFLLLPPVLAAAYVFTWVRERYHRGGPIPVSQARTLLVPLRQRIQPVAQLLEKFQIKPGQTVLELGPGPGYFTIEASRIVGTEGSLLCLDLQRGMLDILHERLDRRGILNAHPVTADATRLPLRDASVDSAFLVAVFGEIPDRVATLRELRRVLKPDGLLSFSETLTDPDYVFQDTLRDLCRATGFEEVQTHRERLGYTALFRPA
jgi:ubiquinone/menaquinone biosynthesis C-methylase UbiE